MVLYFKKYPPVIKRAYIKQSLKFSLPIIPYQLMFAGFSNIDRFVLERNFTSHDFGVYNFAVMVTGLIPVFLNALSNATNPKIFRELANNGNMDTIKKYNRLTLFFSTGLICFSIAGVVPVMRIFINKDYSDAYIYIGTLFLSFLPYLHYLIYNIPLFYFGKTKSFPVIAFCALLSGIVFNKLFIPVLGIWTVCLSLYVIRLVQAAVAYLYIAKHKFDQLPYVKHGKLIAGSFFIIIIYNVLLLLHTRMHVLPIDVINTSPLICFLLLSFIIYRLELTLLLKSLPGIKPAKP
jgi:O-antigen/teichoic acid export membrane protein